MIRYLGMTTKISKLHIGKRVLKTMFALCIALGIYLLLLALNHVLGYTELPSYYTTSDIWWVPTNFYTPFFGGIAVCYALQSSLQQSHQQAKIRSVGSLVGGYTGVVVVLLFEYLQGIFHLTKAQYSYYILLYGLVILGFIPLMKILVKVDAKYAGFITCLTYLSVTISVRNGGLDVFLFANNRIISTIIGVQLAIFVNGIPHFLPKNKNILFLAALDNGLFEKSSIVPGNINRMRDFDELGINLTYMASRCEHYVRNAVDPIQPTLPFITLNGCAIFHPQSNSYSDIITIPNKTRIKIEKILKDNNNQFSFVYNEGQFHCYYKSLLEEGSRAYFENIKKDGRNIVNAEVPSNLDISMMVIIDKQQVINKLLPKLEKIKDLHIYSYKTNLKEGYSILRIMSKDATKDKAISKLKEYTHTDYVVTIAGRRYDMDAMEASDFTICSSLASKPVQEKAHLVIDTTDTKKLINEIIRIYHAKDYKAYIQKISNKTN